jgi:hypothetical protein
MDAIVETTFERLIDGHERRAMLRYLIIKGKGTAASTWTATLTTAHDAGGAEIGSESFSVVVGPGITSKKYSVPRGLAGVYAKLKLRNNALGERGVVEGARLEFVPRPGRGER